MVSNDRAFPDDLFEYQQAYISFRNKKRMAEKHLRTCAKNDACSKYVGGDNS